MQEVRVGGVLHSLQDPGWEQLGGVRVDVFFEQLGQLLLGLDVALTGNHDPLGLRRACAVHGLRQCQDPPALPVRSIPQILSGKLFAAVFPVIHLKHREQSIRIIAGEHTLAQHTFLQGSGLQPKLPASLPDQKQIFQFTFKMFHQIGERVPVIFFAHKRGVGKIQRRLIHLVFIAGHPEGSQTQTLHGPHDIAAIKLDAEKGIFYHI